MAALRIVLVVLLVALGAYTAVVIANHGLGLLPVFFGDLGRMEWPGQFNADFMTFLTLSALWTAWRNAFSPLGLALAPLAFFGGMLFLATYLLILTFRVRSVDALLLGPSRVAESVTPRHTVS